jgi:hypothetical protein
MGLGSNDYFVTDTALSGGLLHGPLEVRLGRAVSIWTVMYNGRGTDIVLQVTRDNTNHAEKG